MKAVGLVPIVVLIGACGAQEISFETPDAGAGAGVEAGPESSTEGQGGGCLSDTDCHLPDLHCDISGQCVACITDDQCTSSGRRRCDFALDQCVECGTDGDCQGGECDHSSRRCVPTCADGSPCPGSLFCNQASLCVACTSNAGCQGLRSPGPYCNAAVGQCVECLVDAQCPYDRPRCNPTTNRCVECLRSVDCNPHEACEPMSHYCVDYRVGPVIDGGLPFVADSGDSGRR